MTSQYHYVGTRWLCPRCGRFIAEGGVRSWDVLDPGEYYGIRGVIVGDCSRCSEVDDPKCVPISVGERCPRLACP